MWFSSFAMDTKIADGAGRPLDPALARRATALTSPRVREDLARSVRRVIGDAREPANPLRPRAPVAREEVVAASHELRQLASRLLAPMPVTAHGVAKVRLLLSDGSGPLYRRDRPGDLSAAARDALASL